MVTIGGESPSINRVSGEKDMVLWEKNSSYLNINIQPSYLNINIQPNEGQTILHHLELTVTDPLG